jgi:hypothetical protein
MDALQTAAHSLHRDTSAAAAATLAETIRQGCKDVQSRAVFLAQVQAWQNTHTFCHSTALLFESTYHKSVFADLEFAITRRHSVTSPRT